MVAGGGRRHAVTIQVVSAATSITARVGPQRRGLPLEAGLPQRRAAHRRGQIDGHAATDFQERIALDHPAAAADVPQAGHDRLIVDSQFRQREIKSQGMVRENGVGSRQ